MEDIEKLMSEAVEEEDTKEEDADGEEEEEEEDTETEEKSSPKATGEAKTTVSKETEEAISKLKQEICDNAENTQLVIVGSELVKDFKKDDELAKAYLENKQTIKTIWDAIFDEVKAHYKDGSFAMLPDEQVYSMAREQCHLPPKKKEEPKKATEPTATEKHKKVKEDPKPTDEASKLMKKATEKVKKEESGAEQINFDDLLFGGTNNGKNNA